MAGARARQARGCAPPDGRERRGRTTKKLGWRNHQHRKTGSTIRVYAFDNFVMGMKAPWLEFSKESSARKTK